uniref:Uncharacterized protein n=1 Tax=Anguilla anguilla TaxID=7936 RepID=A0A0E9TVT4_ANGAN
MKRNCRGIAGKSHNDASETVCLFQSSAGRRSCIFGTYSKLTAKVTA